MTAIAAAAGVSAGALYRHFPSKSDLAVEIFRRASGRELEVLRDVADSGGSAQDLLRRTVAVFARRALDGPVLAFALLAEPADPAVEAERLLYRRQFREVFAQIVSAGVANGELPAQDSEVTAAAVVGAAAEILVGPLSGASSFGSTGAYLVERVCEMATRCAGIAPNSSGAAVDIPFTIRPKRGA